MAQETKCICGKLFLARGITGKFCSKECRTLGRKEYKYLNKKTFYYKKEEVQTYKKRNLDRTVELGYLNG